MTNPLLVTAILLFYVFDILFIAYFKCLRGFTSDVKNSCFEVTFCVLAYPGKMF